MDCSVCKDLRKALNEHLRSHHGEDVDVQTSEKAAPSNNAPVTPKLRNRGALWTVRSTILGREETTTVVEEKRDRKTAARQAGKPKLQKGTTAIGKLERGVKLERTSPESKTQEIKPKMRQLNLLHMLVGLKNSKCSGRGLQGAVTEKTEKAFEEDKNQSRPPEATKSTVETSTLAEDLQLTSGTVRKDLETFERHSPPSISCRSQQDNKAKLDERTSKPKSTPERDWKPFKRERCDFIAVTDSFGRYPCVWCRKNFSKLSNLTRHLLKHKESRNKQWFACAECGKKFDRKDSLKTHHLSHKNDRPHVCGSCRKRFKHKAHLKEHIKFDRCFKRNSSARY